jgi:hypothetical protein
MKFLWKSIKKTESFDYQQHKLTGARRVVKLREEARSPHHREWLNGGSFNKRGAA